LFEKFMSTNLESFKQRYEGTYGFYRDEKKKRLLVRLESIVAQECVFVNADGIDFRLRPDTTRDIGFEFLPPKSAWYNTPRGAMWTQRLAQRQFSRGVTGKNLEISLMTGQFGVLRVDFTTLAEIYERPIAPKDAMKALDEGKSVAISSAFALDPIKARVYLFKELIGTFQRSEEKKISFTLYEPLNWKTEITDALTAVGYTAEIK
jgi:hypothetical protein